MAEQEQYPQDQMSYEIGLKLRDLEENQRLMRDRILLIGKNLIEMQEKNITEIINLKKDFEDIKSDVKRVKDVAQVFSDEIAKSARKEDIAIISRQLKMFEPLRFARIEDVEKIINEKLNKLNISNKEIHENKKEEHISQNQLDKHEFWRNKI